MGMRCNNMYMNVDEIRNVHVGDQIAYTFPSSIRSHMTLGVVKKITPTGRIRLENGMIFGADGREITSDMRSAYLVTMHEYTAWKSEVNRKNRINAVIAEINDDMVHMELEELEHILCEIKGRDE